MKLSEDGCRRNNSNLCTHLTPMDAISEGSSALLLDVICLCHPPVYITARKTSSFRDRLYNIHTLKARHYHIYATSLRSHGTHLRANTNSTDHHMILGPAIWNWVATLQLRVSGKLQIFRGGTTK